MFHDNNRWRAVFNEVGRPWRAINVHDLFAMADKSATSPVTSNASQPTMFILMSASPRRPDNDKELSSPLGNRPRFQGIALESLRVRSQLQGIPLEPLRKSSSIPLKSLRNRRGFVPNSWESRWSWSPVVEESCTARTAEAGLL